MLNRTEVEQDALQDKLMEAVLWKGPNLPYIAIISAFRPEYTRDENLERHARLKEHLKSYPLKELHGVWGTEHELSWLVVLSGSTSKRIDQYDDLANLVDVFDQEAYLFADRYRVAYLVYRDGRMESLGTLQQVSKEEAETAHSYSYCAKTNTYWLAK